jgi:hypothetical protein
LTDWSSDYRVIRLICWGLAIGGSGYSSQAYTCDQIERACSEVGLLVEGKIERFKISLLWGLLFGVFVKK